MAGSQSRHGSFHLWINIGWQAKLWMLVNTSHINHLTSSPVQTAIQMYWLAAWHSGRTLVSDLRTFSVPCSTCSWQVTTYVRKPSAMGQPTKPCNSAFHPFGVDKLSSEQLYHMCAGRAIWWVFTRLSRCGYQSLCAVCGRNLAELNRSVYS